MSKLNNQDLSKIRSPKRPTTRKQSKEETSDLEENSFKDKNFCTDLNQSLIDKYDLVYTEFMEHDFSQKSQLIIRRLCMSDGVPYEFRVQPLYRLLLGAYQELCLNEIEVSM